MQHQNLEAPARFVLLEHWADRLAWDGFHADDPPEHAAFIEFSAEMAEPWESSFWQVPSGYDPI